MRFSERLKIQLEMNPSRFLALGFFLVILTGSILLTLPISSTSGTFTPFIDAAFTATSAVCVTGLVTVNTAMHWTTFGHVVIITLIQLGGLGIMTWAILIALLMKKRITLRDRLVIHEQMNTGSLQGMVKLIIYVLKSTFLIELIGALLLSFTFVPAYGLGKGIWYSVFHAISSYCNAGFDILGETSVAPYVGSVAVILPISALIVLGGIGFNVYMDVTNKKSFRSLALHSKLALSMTGILLAIGTLLFLLLEYHNPNSIKNEPFFTKLLASFFQSVTTRTAGYFSVDQVNITDASAIVSIILMFIGGSPAGTAGGIKTTTLSLLLLTARSEIKGYEDVVAFNRRISTATIRKALSLIIISLIWISIISLLLTMTEPFPYINLLFETTSAFATVGLTRGVTPGMSSFGKILIMTTMYLGRTGPLTLAFALSRREHKKKYREPKGDVLVG
ncbi:MAG: TrkH family potassium uptake protein [Tissierellia bacterium]|nr:TrkH family potassium uptake protein [Tissierellia bacterium]